jgi:hypothetical protein
MPTPEKNRSIKRAGILLGVLVAMGAVLLWCLLTQAPPEPRRVVATRDLEAFTLLTSGVLEMRPRSPSNTEIAALTGCYLLVAVKQEDEVTRKMVTSREGNEWLADAVAVAIPTSATTSLGGQLHVGDVVDLVTVPKGATEVKTFENLLVLSTAPPSKETNVITLAMPRAQRDAFALAVTGAELVLTRRIIIASQQSK